jgi:predicted dehydrogenase
VIGQTDGAPITVGVIGCGNISGVYLKNCAEFPNLSVLACADLDPERARQRAAEFRVPRACSVEELLADPAIEVVLNLTVPLAHAGISLRALEAGKHVYSEKPLAIAREEARHILDMAQQAGLRVGCAPDTFLGGGLQTARKLIDEGAIGRPVAATAFFMTPGSESWHPDPAPLYGMGAGPLFDMGPYLITALAALLGPVRRVSGIGRITYPERTITSRPRHGEVIRVTTPTHVAALLDFASGAIGTVISSFDVHAHHLPDLEIYGSEGSTSGPDPNFYHGPVRLRRAGQREWRDVHSDSPYTANWRGLGLSDMARAIRCGGSFRASGELAYHVLDVMHAILESSESGRRVEVTSTCERPEPLAVEAVVDDG